MNLFKNLSILMQGHNRTLSFAGDDAQTASVTVNRLIVSASKFGALKSLIP